MKTWLATILLSALTFVAEAQTYSGKVADGKTGKPLNAATVMLLGDGGRTTLCFTRTAANGTFAIKTPPGKAANAIMFSRLGYAKDTIPASSFAQGQTVELRQQAVKIKEVKIKAPRISQRGDTLSYLVNAFKQKQDRSIADVIKKMPGLSVNKDGSIEYQGRPISKFYIEGMDLLGNKYSQASNNVPAEKVKSVQVLQNHQPVKLLRDIDFSQQAALNIVLEDAAKSVWQGAADIAAGTAAQGGGKLISDDRLIAMMFARKMQSISMYKYNNTGKDILGEVDANLVFGSGVPVEKGLLENIRLAEPSIDESRTTFNDSHALASNWLFKTKGGDDVRFQLSGMIDDTGQSRHASTTYADVEGNAVVTEDVSATAMRREVSGEMLYKVNRDNIYATNTLKGFADFNRSRGTSMLNGSHVAEAVKPRKRYVYDSFNMVRKLKSGRNVSLNAYFSYNDLPGSLLLTDDTWQQLGIESMFWGASTYFAHRLGTFNMKYTIDTKGSSKKMKTSHSQGTWTDRYAENKARFSPEISYVGDVFRFRAEFPLSWLARSFNSEGRSDVLVEPKAAFNFEPNVHWAFNASYQYSISPLGLYDISAAPVFTDYISMKQGTGRMDYGKQHAGHLSASYKHTVKGLFASLSGTWFSSSGNVLYRSSLANGIYRSTATDKRAKADGLNMHARVAKSFGNPKISTGLSLYCNLNNYQLLIGETPTPFRLLSTNLAFDCSANPADWFSIEEKTYFTTSRQSNKGSSTQAETRIRSFTHLVNFYFMPGSWRIEWKNEIYHSSDRSVSFYFFSDISTSYRIKTYEVGLSLNNIFGRSVYQRREINAAMQQYTVSVLRPREVTAKISFSL